jgi:nicotinamidase-related amidase
LIAGIKMKDYLTELELELLLPKWMEQLDDFRTRFRQIDVKRSALVVVDMQKEFLLEDGLLPVWGGPAVLPRLKRVIDVFRKANLPVLHTKHCYYNAEIDGGATGLWWQLDRNSPLLRADRANTEIHPDIAPQTNEYVVTKHRYSGFFATNLEALLRSLQVRDVVIAGVASNCCSEATAHDAFFRDFQVFFLADGNGGSDEASHIAVLRDIAWTYGTVLTCGDLIDQLERGISK